MKKEAWVLIAWICAEGCSAWANDTPVWHQGQLVLQRRTELKGELIYNWQAQIIQYRQGNMIKAYSVNQIQGFAYFNDQLAGLRMFVPMEYSVKSGLRRLRILEEVVSGRLLVYQEHVPMFKLIKASRSSAYASHNDAETNYHNFSYLVF